MAEFNVQVIDDALELFEASKEILSDDLKRQWLAAAIRKFGQLGALGPGHYQLWAGYIERTSRDWTGTTLAIFDMQLFCDNQSHPQEVRDRVRELLAAGIEACK